MRVPTIKRPSGAVTWAMLSAFDAVVEAALEAGCKVWGDHDEPGPVGRPLASADEAVAFCNEVVDCAYIMVQHPEDLSWAWMWVIPQNEGDAISDYVVTSYWLSRVLDAMGGEA